MDLYVERQYIEQMKSADPKKFLLLFDEYFQEVYAYVARRVGFGDDAERITRLVFMDALGQIPSTPVDANYLVWLYKLAKPRVWKYMETAQSLQTGVIAEGEEDDQQELVQKTEKVFSKLSLEEREILRLKFFEEVTDGDVMAIIDSEETSIGPKIYRVLKRAHFLLFGESDDRQGVYFGELSGFLERARQIENIPAPEMFRGVLRTELDTKLSKEDYAIEVEEETVEAQEPFVVKEDAVDLSKPTGSDDPAKIFVQAAREMQEEEQEAIVKQTERFERSERIFDFIDRWKHVLAMIPIAVFVIVMSIVVINFFGMERGGERIVRGSDSAICEVEVSFEGDFSETQKRKINEGVSDRICGNFVDVTALHITRLESGKVYVEVDIENWFLEYKFVKKYDNWRIKTYERTISSND